MWGGWVWGRAGMGGGAGGGGGGGGRVGKRDCQLKGELTIDVRLAHWLPGKLAEGQALYHPFDENHH